jgi:hypothetical protein
MAVAPATHGKRVFVATSNGRVLVLNEGGQLLDSWGELDEIGAMAVHDDVFVSCCARGLSLRWFLAAWLAISGVARDVAGTTGRRLGREQAGGFLRRIRVRTTCGHFTRTGDRLSEFERGHLGLLELELFVLQPGSLTVHDARDGT